MEEITMERLTNDMAGVIAQINSIVANKDIEGARKLLAQIENLVANENGIQLDKASDVQYDHVLHELLKNISGVIEIAEVKGEDPDLSDLYGELDDINNLLSGGTDKQREELEKKLDKLTKEIAKAEKRLEELKNAEVKEPLSEDEKKQLKKDRDAAKRAVDKNQAEIDDKKAGLDDLKRQRDEEVARINAEVEEEVVVESTPEDLRDQAENKLREYAEQHGIDPSELKIVRTEIEDYDDGPRNEFSIVRVRTKNDPILTTTEREGLEKELEDAQKELDELKKKQEDPELESKLADLRKQLKSSADRMAEYKNVGAYNQEAAEHQEYNKIAGQIQALEKEKREKQNPNYEQEIADLRKQLKASADRMAEYRRVGAYDQEAAEHQEYNKIVRRISALEGKAKDAQRIKELEAKVSDIKAKLEYDDKAKAKNSKVQELDAQIAALEKEIEGLEEKQAGLVDKYNELNSKVKENALASRSKKSLENKIKKASELLEAKKREKSEVQDKLGSLPKDIDRESLEARKKEIEAEIKKRLDEKGVSKDSDRLDLGAEAARIGDKIFKTAEIRKELSEREITREEFLAFYQEGREVARKNIERLEQEANAVIAEVGAVYTDKDSSETLQEQAQKALEEKDEAKLVVIYEKMRKNFMATGRYNEHLEALGLADGEIKSMEDVQKMMKFTEHYDSITTKALADIKVQADDQRENLEIFDREIKIIESEMEAIKTGNIDEIKAKSATEKELRARQIEASMFGDPELQEDWDKRFKRFYGKKTTKEMTYVDEHGETKTVQYETIESYDGMAEDALFLNLEDYRKNLELITKFENSGRDPRVLGEDAKGKTIEQIQAEMADRQRYVSTFHGLTNKHAVRYENLMTGGSTLLAMKPVKGDLPVSTKVANAAENTLRFFGIRVPKFTRVNENGEKVVDIKGGLATLAIDAALVGGVVATGVLTGPIGLAGWGIGYAARGAVLLGNRAAARVEMSRYSEQITENIPTPYEATKDAREVARKEYYREEQGMGKFTSWVKAKADRLPFFRKRALETEEAIVQQRIALSDETIDRRDSAAIKAVQENRRRIDENQKKRQDNYRSVARGANTYNDVVRDPDSLDRDKAPGAIARNAALRANGSEGREDVNPTSKAERKEQYAKPEDELAKTEELDEVKTQGGSISSTAITVEQQYTGEQQRIDRWNKVWTTVLTVAGNIGLKAITDGFMREKVVKTQEPDTVQTVSKRVPKYEPETTTELDPTKTISEYGYDQTGRNDIYGGASAHTGHSGDIDAVSLGITDANGKTIEVSFAEAGGGYSTKHVHDILNYDISNMTPEQIIKTFRTTDAENLKKFVEAAGLSPNATDAEIAKYAIENGNFFGQTAKMEGWRILDKAGLDTVTRDVFKGWEIVTEQVVVPGKVVETVVKEFDPRIIIEEAGKAALIGTAIGAADQAHEANRQTKKREPGTHEQLTPTALMSKIAKAAQEKLNREREEKRSAEEQGRDDSDKDDLGL